MYLVINAPKSINKKDKCNNKTAHFSFLKRRYLKILPKKLIAIKTISNSNHHALYIHIFAVSVLYHVSIKVPKAIAVG